MLLKFCLATIGVCVFRCADFGWRAFLFMKGERMEKERCDYCGQEYDKDIMKTLGNGCPACPNCVKEEEKRKGEKNHE